MRRRLRHDHPHIETFRTFILGEKTNSEGVHRRDGRVERTWLKVRNRDNNNQKDGDFRKDEDDKKVYRFEEATSREVQGYMDVDDEDGWAQNRQSEVHYVGLPGQLATYSFHSIPRESRQEVPGCKKILKQNHLGCCLVPLYTQPLLPSAPTWASVEIQVVHNQVFPLASFPSEEAPTHHLSGTSWPDIIHL